MLNISLKYNRDLYTDYEKCLKLLRDVALSDYTYPDITTNFHVFTEIKTPKELMVVKSYLATQNLDKTHMHVWSEYDINDNNLIKPYKDYVTLKVYDPYKESKDTILEGRKDILDVDDNNHWMSSGVFRFVVPHNYGGVYSDMDVIFLRDMKPILDQEYAYMWGSEMDFEEFGPCAAFMAFLKESELVKLCLDEISKTEIHPMSTCLDHALLAKVYKKRKFTVFPSVFFDTEWQINSKHPGLGDKIQDGWFQMNDYSHYVFPEAFAWHWHNTSMKNKDIHPQSKFGKLQSLIDDRLRERKIL